MIHALGGQAQGIPNDPGAMLRMLEEQQVSLTVQIANAQQQLREAQMTAERTGGADAARIRTFVVQNEVHVAALKERLGTIRDQIASTQDAVRSAPVVASGAPVAVAISRDPNTIFMLKPTEFYSAAGFLLLLPLVLAYARRIWRGGAARPNAMEALEGSPQITRLEQAVEAVAIEVERISEAQRFSAKLMAERPKEPVIERIKGQRKVVTPLP